MKSYLRNGAAAIALLAGVGLASAQSGMMETSIQLTPAQKSAIYNTVSKENVSAAPALNLRLAVGSELPASIELHPLPADALAEIPAIKPYRYTVVQKQVVLVEPRSRKVVEIIRQ